MDDDERLGRLQAAIGYEFRDRAVALAALTHPSLADYAFRDSPLHQKLLAHLGDSVLELAIRRQQWLTLSVSRLLDEREVLSQGSVANERLAEVMASSQLDPLIRAAPGALANESRVSVLADALEALIGAVYLDGGHDAAVALVGRLVPLLRVP